MSSRRVFTREYKLAAIKKIIEQGLTFVEAAREMGISDSALRAWKKSSSLMELYRISSVKVLQ
jgi:transposase